MTRAIQGSWNLYQSGGRAGYGQIGEAILRVFGVRVMMNARAAEAARAARTSANASDVTEVMRRYDTTQLVSKGSRNLLDTVTNNLAPLEETAGLIRKFLSFSGTVPRNVRTKFADGFGNVATSKLHLLGDQQPTVIHAFSGTANVQGFARYVPNEQRVLAAGGAGGSYIRDVDAEAKILESVLGITTDGSKGVLRVFTEKAPCDSCMSIFRNLQRYRNGITIEIGWKGGARTLPARGG